MFPDVPVFDGLRDAWDDRVTAWDLGKRPVRRRKSDASVLDPDTAIVADCETSLFRALIREHPDPAAAEEIAETQHQIDLEKAAQPPVIEVTVTTPPEGIARAELQQVVAAAVSSFTGPQPVLPDEFVVERPWRGKVLRATRRAVQRRRGRPLAPPPVPVPPVPVSEDDTPTGPIAPYTGDFELVEVHVP